ncbi:TPA: hypothetical protein MHK42_26895, partial [Klebsiella pneumoniae]|nr:hypothetical protein [Klebsiella pneumoniae]
MRDLILQLSKSSIYSTKPRHTSSCRCVGCNLNYFGYITRKVDKSKIPKIYFTSVRYMKKFTALRVVVLHH